MKKKKYNMSEKRLNRDYSQTNWEQKMEVARLMNQGWKSRQIGEKFGVTRQRIEKIFSDIKGKTIEELEQLAKKHE